MEQGGLRRRGAFGAPGELEVLVGGHGAVGQRQCRRLVPGAGERDLMERAGDVAEDEAGVQLHLDRHRVDLAVLVGIEHGRGDAVAVGHRVGRALLAAEVDDVDFAGRRAVARRDDQREAQGEDPPVLLHRLLILDADDDGFVRADIGHRVGEDVGALLLDETRLLACVLGRLVERLGVLAALNLAFDHAVADLHAERVHRGLLGQGKDIDALEPAIARVLEALGDDGAGDGAVDVDDDVGGKPRGLDIAVLGSEEEGARVHVAGRHALRGAFCRCGAGDEAGSGKDGNEKDEKSRQDYQGPHGARSLAAHGHRLALDARHES